MALSDYLGNKVVDAVFNNTALAIATPYVSLHTGDPGVNGANEVVGGTYVRKLGSFGAGASKALDNDAVIDFPGMPTTTVTHVGLWMAESAGNYLLSAQLTAPKPMAAGETLQFAIGALDGVAA